MNEAKSKRYIGTVSVITAGIVWGMMGLFVRGLSAAGLSSMDIVLLRSLVSAILMFLFLAVYDKRLLIIKLKDIWCFIGTGVISLTLFNVCYFTTIQKTSMAVAAILLYTSPIFVVIMSAIIFKEKINALKLISMIIAALGCAFVTGVIGESSAVLSAKGILIGICSGIGYAFYSIFSRFALERGYSSLTIIFYTFLFSTIATLFFVRPEAAWHIIIFGEAVKTILLILGIATVSTILPYLLYTFGLTYVENGKAAIMVSVEPVMAAILGSCVYKEILPANGYVGIALVILAIILLNLNIKKK